MPSGVRMIGGRALPPDVLRNRLSQEQQASIANLRRRRWRNHPIAVQAAFVAAMLASEPAKWRTQLTRLAPVLGIELMKETQAQIARIAELRRPGALPLLSDLLFAARRHGAGATANACAPSRAPSRPPWSRGDMLRFAVTRMLEKRTREGTSKQAPPVPLPERAPAVCALYAALAQCRFGADKQGQNAYRAGLMGMLPPQKWAPYPGGAARRRPRWTRRWRGLAQMHPTGKRSFSEGMARVIAVGGRLTVPQVDLLRGVCLIVDCPVPVIAGRRGVTKRPKRRRADSGQRAIEHPRCRRAAGTRRTPVTGAGATARARRARPASR